MADRLSSRNKRKTTQQPIHMHFTPKKKTLNAPIQQQQPMTSSSSTTTSAASTCEQRVETPVSHHGNNFTDVLCWRRMKMISLRKQDKKEKNRMTAATSTRYRHNLVI